MTCRIRRCVSRTADLQSSYSRKYVSVRDTVLPTRISRRLAHARPSQPSGLACLALLVLARSVRRAARVPARRGRERPHESLFRKRACPRPGHVRARDQPRDQVRARSRRGHAEKIQALWLGTVGPNVRFYGRSGCSASIRMGLSGRGTIGDVCVMRRRGLTTRRACERNAKLTTTYARCHMHRGLGRLLVAAHLRCTSENSSSL